MTPEEFKKEVEDIVKKSEDYYLEKYGSDDYDNESVHLDMDELMCKVLRELGYGDGVDIFEKTDKWYA